MSETKPLTPAEARRLWVEALRSGEYEQGRTWLRENDRYCCLGVACELYRKHTGIGRWESNCFDSGSGAKSQYVSDEVKRWLGMTTYLGAYGDHSNLAATNDKGISFSAIADLIESNPPGLFVEGDPNYGGTEFHDPSDPTYGELFLAMRVREQRDVEMAQAYCRAVGPSNAVVTAVYSENAWKCWLLSIPTQEGAARISQLATAYLSGMYAERDRAEKGAGA